MKYREALTEAMASAMMKPNTLLIGQGVTDYKGIWGTTLGLAEKYPDRVIETPLSEDAIAGICLGASLNGMYPRSNSAFVQKREYNKWPVACSAPPIYKSTCPQ